VYQHLCDSLKASLHANIQTASPATLDKLLGLTFRFIAISEDLKLIPVSIIQRMSKIPAMYLKALADKRLRGIFGEFPLNVRRQILESSTPFFLEEVEPSLLALVDIRDLGTRKTDARFGSLCDMICGSETLFVITCDWLAQKVVSGGPEWASVLRQMLIIIDTRGNKVSSW
jgi:hypothetical protein